MSLQKGDRLPDFELEYDENESVSNKSLLGTKFILFFYPKDDSPGCTKEACSVRDHFKQISKLGYEVFGVSPDTVKKHKKFTEKYEFQYKLLSDPDKKTIESFGLWGPKKFMGREITGVYRTSFIVDEKGIIQSIISKVKTKDHGLQLLSEIQSFE